MKYIETMPGPEDMVFDLEEQQIIVSCCQRRSQDGSKKRKDWKTGYGFIDLATDQFYEFFLDNLPANAQIKPHGIDLVKENGKRYLYSISHCALDGSNGQTIIKFEVKSDRLSFVRSFQSSEYLISPNDITVLPDGSFYVTNSSTNTTFIGKALDQIFNFKTSNVIHYNNGTWQKVVEKLPFANGIASRNGLVYVAPTYDNSLHVYKIEGSGRLDLLEKIKATKGMDNIIFVDDIHALVAVHTNFSKFIKYAFGLSKVSPSAVYKFNIQQKKFETIYEDDGQIISTCSTAILHQNKLYLSQIFRDQVIVVDMA